MRSAVDTQQRLTLFDFDGVIARGDTFASWLRGQFRQSPARRVVAGFFAPLGLLLLSRPATISLGVRLFLRIAVLGADPQRIRDSIEQHAQMLAADQGRWIVEGLAMLRKHLADGERVIIVSGCEQTMVRRMLDLVGCAGVEIVASRLDFTGTRVRIVRHCLGRQKIQGLREVGVDQACAVAYSDSPSDLPMLAGATVAICVNWALHDRHLAQSALGARAQFVDWA